MEANQRDCWAEWLLRRRFGDDERVREDSMRYLSEVRDRVLTNAGVSGGETLLDVGCGDGLIGFGALDRGAGSVIFADISADLLKTCRSIAVELGVEDRCQFVRTSAEDLAQIDERSVDVVTTRSVLIYIEDKRRAFDEFFRVLRSSGRISLFEPINRRSNFFTTYDTTPVQELFDRVRAVFERIQPPGEDPMLNFDERDLMAFAERAGFPEVRLRMEVVSKPPRPRPWETFLRAAGNPKIPSFGEAMAQVLSSDEQARLAAHLRPLVEGGQGRIRMASAYLWAMKGLSRDGQ